VVSWPVVAVGAGVAIVFGFLWAREVTRDVRTAPPAPEPEPVHELAVEPEEDEDEAGTYTRSKFLEGSTLGLGALIGGIVTVPVVGFAVAPAFVGQGYDEVDLGPLENFAENGWVVVTFLSEKEPKSDVSRRTAFVRNNGFKEGVPRFTIIPTRCVHLGCRVQPSGPSEGPKTIETESGAVTLKPSQPSGFSCPCHGGAYDTEGNRTAGPPVRALDRYKFSIVDGRLLLGDPYSVGKVNGAGADAQIESYSISDPGVHVDGWEQVFYPYVP
jgi:Rieske Fe-S protein